MNRKMDGIAGLPRRWVRAFAVGTACGLLLFVSACIGNDWGAPAIHGVLVEQGSNKPLAGAIAVARWEGIPQSLGGHGGACVHIDTAITDAEGKFVIPAWQLGEMWRGSSGVVFHGGTGFPKFYLRGYKQIIDNVTLPLGRADRANIRTFFMEPDVSTPYERMRTLGRFEFGCALDEGGNLSTNVLFRALYEEGKEIADRTDRDQSLLLGWQEYGNAPFRNSQTVKRGSP